MQATPRLAALALALAGACALPASAAVLIGQVYGAGGNSGAAYNADFVELRNTGSSAVDLSGWSLQYTSSSGTSWANQKVVLSGSIPAGGYYLVRLGSGGAAGVALPAADATGSFNMSASNGKLALVNGSAGLDAAICPAPGASVVDFIGYGSANCAESSPAPALSSSTALFRAGSGCTDSGNNGTDFATAAPQPRNAASPAAACGGGGGPLPQDLAIYSIQGSGTQSPHVGVLARSSGVVTRLTNNGFFMQDPVGDGNPATSDGIFVFTGATAWPAAALGNLVRVTGTVAEFNTGAAGNADTAARTVTELGSVSAVELLGSGSAIAPVVVQLPEAANDELERYEGMLVTLVGPFTVGQNFFQGRYGQLTLSVGGRMETPTNRHRPGSPQAMALADANARSRIVLDDGSTLQNPRPTPYLSAGVLPRAGDRLGSITGVIDYGLATSSNTGFGDYRILATQPIDVLVANPRTAAPEPVGGNLKLASFNVLNYFTTFTDGTTAGGGSGQGCTLGGDVNAANCRGADNLAEFQRQRAKAVEALVAMDADIVGLMEIQNNGNTAVQNLVDALNARLGGPVYATLPLPAQGTGSDAIRVALIHKPARVSPVGLPLSDTAPVNNRPPLAQAFAMPNGERLTVIVNHLKSKGSCPAVGDADYAGNFDSGDGQGCWNGLRRQQALQLRNFAALVQGATGTARTLLVGDFNAYAMEDPIVDLADGGFADQVARFHAFGYSYVFDGAAGRLDHALASSALAPLVTGVVHWPINADEMPTLDYNQEFKAPALCGGALCPDDPYTVSPYRSSDHDPVLVGIGLYKSIVAAAGTTPVVGSAGDDQIQVGSGRRTISGNGGNDRFVFPAGYTGGATITDFASGDTISMKAVLQGLGVQSTEPIAQGHLTCRASGADAMIGVDPDAAGPAAVRYLLLLRNQGCSVLNTTTFVH